MRGYGLLIAVLVGGALLLFGLVEWAALPLLTDPLPAMRGAGVAAAFLGPVLLTADLFLPVPASVVMVAHGSLFGLVPGAAVSLLGGLSATLLGFALGRWGRGIVERVTTPTQRSTAHRLLTRWGPWAVVSTRAVPVLAETVAVLAGTSPMRWSVLMCAGAAGNAVPALLYAAVGAGASKGMRMLLVWGLALAFFGLLVVTVGRLRRSSRSRNPAMAAHPPPKAPT